MPNTHTHLMKATPSIVPGDLPLLSDDECVLRLAQTVADHDSEHLDELARLIGRLAVTIEV
jgi:predicted transcriptional regulator